MLETPHSFINAMEGAALRRKREHDHAVFTAWHVAVFGLGMYRGKLKGKLADYMTGDGGSPRRSKSAEAIAFFHTLKARGVPVEITRLN